MNDIQLLTDELDKFRDARNWGQLDNTKDLALGISIEAEELNELFLRKMTGERPVYLTGDKRGVEI